MDDFSMDQYGVINPDAYEGNIAQKINMAQVYHPWRPLKIVVPVTGGVRIFDDTIYVMSDVTLDFQNEALEYTGRYHALATAYLAESYISEINIDSPQGCLRASVQNLDLRITGRIEKDAVNLTGFRSSFFQARISKNVYDANSRKALVKLRSGNEAIGGHRNRFELDLFGNRKIDEGFHIVSAGNRLCNANFISVSGSLFKDAIVWIEDGVGNMVRDCVWEQSRVGIRDQGRRTLIDWNSIYHEQLGVLAARR